MKQNKTEMGIVFAGIEMALDGVALEDTTTSIAFDLLQSIPGIEEVEDDKNTKSLVHIKSAGDSIKEAGKQIVDKSLTDIKEKLSMLKDKEDILIAGGVCEVNNIPVSDIGVYKAANLPPVLNDGLVDIITSFFYRTISDVKDKVDGIDIKVKKGSLIQRAEDISIYNLVRSKKLELNKPIDNSTLTLPIFIDGKNVTFTSHNLHNGDISIITGKLRDDIVNSLSLYEISVDDMRENKEIIEWFLTSQDGIKAIGVVFTNIGRVLNSIPDRETETFSVDDAKKLLSRMKSIAITAEIILQNIKKHTELTVSILNKCK